MATDNPNALTWVFSYQVSDPEDPAPELAILKQFAGLSLVQYAAYQVVQHSERHTVYIRSVVRFYRPRSLLQLKSYLPGLSAKPLRGVFTATVVADKLRPTNRIGPLYEYGFINPSTTVKRPLDCDSSCPSCCLSNKRVAL